MQIHSPTKNSGQSSGDKSINEIFCCPTVTEVEAMWKDKTIVAKGQRGLSSNLMYFENYK